jgi:LPXTG-motif cell wall-anchored protein
MNIIYVCSINEEAEGYPEAGEQAQLALSNQVDVYYDKDAENGAAASNTIQATIDRTSEIKNVIDKNGTWNNKSKILSYSVEANPYGEDLVSETATLELVDELTYVQDGSITASLMMDSVKLYYATLSEDEEGNPILEKGASVDSLNWSWKIEETQRDSASGTLAVKTITVTIPDSTPVILEYNYQVTKTDDGNLDIQNSANIQGTEYEADVSGSDKDEWNNVNTGVTVEITPSYTFYKVDEKNYSIRLAGAEFTLFRYRDNQWEDTGIVLTTDKKGTISFSKKNFSATATQESYTASKLTLRNNVAYYLIETKAPKGYNLPSNPPQYYFYCEDSNSNATAQYPSGWGKEETYKTAVNMAKNSATSYVKNSRPTTDVQVAKTWTLNEELTDEHPDSLTVYLKQYAVTKSVADTLLSEDESKSLQQVLGEIMDTGENVRLVTQAKRVLNKGNAAGDQWVYTWTGLPTWDDADDESENSEAVYYYYVVEEDTESEDLNGWIGSCEVTYEQSENSDYPEQISYHWTNNKTWEIYTLPATGGKGEMLFYIIGGVLMALAVIGYVIMKRKGKRKK